VAAQAHGIIFCRQVADDDAETELLPQIAGGPLDQGGLAGAGGGQDVQDEESLGLEVAAVPLGQAVVLVQDALFDGDCAVVLVGMRMRVFMVVPVGVVLTVRMIMIVAVCLQALRVRGFRSDGHAVDGNVTG
jgi:hypothetical protein